MTASIPPRATVVSFKTGRPIEDGASPSADPMALLRRIASQAMTLGADPATSVAEDHDLLMLCDEIVLTKRHCDRLEAAWRISDKPGAPAKSEGYEEWRSADRALRRTLFRLRKLPAITAPGLFAKAAAISVVGAAASLAAVMLAGELLASAELRKAVWPAIEASPSHDA